MALKKISHEANKLLIEQASTQTVLTGKKVWESDLLERYIKQGVARDKKKQIRKQSTATPESQNKKG